VNVTGAALSAAGDDQQKAAPLGLFVLLLMGVACYFLFKSMSRHMRKVREDFGPTAPPTEPSPDPAINKAVEKPDDPQV
jgi:hypothetical protein